MTPKALSREIKFRAWDKVDKEMRDWDWAKQSPMYLLNIEESSFVFMQYTGLLDKNGKEIYENDYLEGGGINVWWVKWGSGKYILQNISTGDIIDCNENHTQRQEIVGNSYESPREHPAMASDL